MQANRIFEKPDSAARTEKRKEKRKREKTCLIDVGGGLRGIYAAGILDCLLDEDVAVDLCIGVSAGSANLATYIAGQKGRCYAYYHDYSRRPEYASLSNLASKKSFFDMDYIYGTLSNSDGEYPLDYPAMADSKTDLIVVATNALTGRPVYLDKSRVAQDNYAVMKGSCAVPYLCHTWNIAGVPFCDGTVSDPIPVEKALQMGAERIVVLISRRPELMREDRFSASALHALKRFSRYGHLYPNVAQALSRRASINNRSIRLARKLEEEGKLLFVSACDLHGVGSLGGSPENVDALYQEGYQDGKQAAAFLKGLPFAKHCPLQPEKKQKTGSLTL